MKPARDTAEKGRTRRGDDLRGRNRRCCADRCQRSPHEPASDPTCGGLQYLEEPEIDAEAARFLEASTWSLLQALGAHFQYPVLHYFRPQERTRSLAVQLAPMIRHVRARRQEHVSKGLAHDAFVEAVERYLTLVESHFIPKNFEPDAAPGGSTDAERAYARLLRFMRYDRQ